MFDIIICNMSLAYCQLARNDKKQNDFFEGDKKQNNCYLEEEIQKINIGYVII